MLSQLTRYCININKKTEQGGPYAYLKSQITMQSHQLKKHFYFVSDISNINAIILYAELSKDR